MQNVDILVTNTLTEKEREWIKDIPEIIEVE
jgi:hypothetical protein